MIRALGLAGGYVLDQLFGDPKRHHPVALFGSLAKHWENRIYHDHKASGVLYGVSLVFGAAGLAKLVEAKTKSYPWLKLSATVITTWAVLGGKSLAKEGDIIAQQIRQGELDAARTQITHLVSRNPDNLTLPEITRAATESVAENTSDAVVAPLFWGSILGLPGLVGFRAANTLDAMVGYRNQRYQNFGWFSAKLDDLLGFFPSRLTAAITWAAAPLINGSREAVIRALANAKAHPSPNAGWVEGAFAGALGVRLGGENHYGERVEYRVVLGEGTEPKAEDLVRATKLLQIVGFGAVLVAMDIAIEIMGWKKLGVLLKAARKNRRTALA